MVRKVILLTAALYFIVAGMGIAVPGTGMPNTAKAAYETLHFISAHSKEILSSHNAALHMKHCCAAPAVPCMATADEPLMPKTKAAVLQNGKRQLKRLICY